MAVLNNMENDFPGALFGQHMNNALFRCGAFFGRVGKAISPSPVTLSSLRRKIMAAFDERMDGVPKTGVSPQDLLDLLHEIITEFLDKRQISP